MTTYEINPNSAGVSIQIAGVGEQQEQLLEAFSRCQQGQCSCPTDEYRKVESMEVLPEEGEISIQLSAKAGTDFDIGQITACLDCTVGQTTHQTDGEHRR